MEKVVRIIKLEVPALPNESAGSSQQVQEGDGSVTQRFCIAILQKMSIKEQVIEVLVQRGMI